MPLVNSNLGRPYWTNHIGSYSLPLSSSGEAPIKGINIGNVSSLESYDPIRNMVSGLSKNTTEGSPGSPCIQLDNIGFWRFRWVVKPGQRRIAVRTKQVKSVSGLRPSLIVKRNVVAGITTDLSATAPAGNDWVVIGPIIFTATGTDMVWVECRNNLQMDDAPCYFDHIVAL